MDLSGGTTVNFGQSDIGAKGEIVFFGNAIKVLKNWDVDAWARKIADIWIVGRKIHEESQQKDKGVAKK